MPLFHKSTYPVIYLHIGMNKTGTTALQAWLKENRTSLSKKFDLLFPESGFERGAHFGLSDTLGFRNNTQDSGCKTSLAHLQQKFSKEVARSGCRTVCISSENFVIDKDISSVQTFFENYRCKVVVYLRRHDSWIESGYRQAVKMVRNPDYPEGIKSFINRLQKRSRNYINYQYLTDKWAKAFGTENIIVRPYEPEQMPKGIVADFLEIVDKKEAMQLGNSPRNNRSLSKFSTQVLETAQRADLTDNQYLKVLKYVQKHDLPDDGFSLLPPRRRAGIVAAREKQYQYIARTYLNRSDGRLFYAPPPSANDTWEPPDPIPAYEQVKCILKALQENN